MSTTEQTIEEYDADIERVLCEMEAERNAGPVCSLMRRVAFSRWRRVLLTMGVWANDAQWWLRDRGWRRLANRVAWWDERIGDALYPRGCMIRFAGKAGAE